MLDSIAVPRPRGDWAQMGQNGGKGLKTGQNRPKTAPFDPFDPPKGSGNIFRKSGFDRSPAHFDPGTDPSRTLAQTQNPGRTGPQMAQNSSK